MTTVTAAMRPSDVEVDDRLRVWCERWRHAPDATSRAHAQTAIDHLLDCRLEHDLAVLAIPAQDVPIELVAHAVA